MIQELCVLVIPGHFLQLLFNVGQLSAFLARHERTIDPSVEFHLIRGVPLHHLVYISAALVPSFFS